MGEVISAAFGRKTVDGGKSRILSRRQQGLILAARDILSQVDDLVMQHADNGMPCDVAYSAPECDPA